MAEGAPQELIDQMGTDTIRVVGQGDHGGFAEKVRALGGVVGGGAVWLAAS